jgi:uncharacterized membrane protein YfcA
MPWRSAMLVIAFGVAGLLIGAVLGLGYGIYTQSEMLYLTPDIHPQSIVIGALVGATLSVTIAFGILRYRRRQDPTRPRR